MQQYIYIYICTRMSCYKPLMGMIVMVVNWIRCVGDDPPSMSMGCILRVMNQLSMDIIYY